MFLPKGPSCTARLVPILDHSDGATDGATVESPASARARPGVCAINEPRGTLDSGHNTGTVHAERLLMLEKVPVGHGVKFQPTRWHAR